MPVLRSCLTFVLLTLLTLSAVAEEGRTSLFDGKTLDGWVQKGGQASFVAKDGMLVGHSVPKTPNSFLCTEKRYSDFADFFFKKKNNLELDLHNPFNTARDS